jgi:hypothetical protein
MMSTARLSIQGINDWRAARQFDVALQVVGGERFFEPDDVVVGEHFRRLAGPVHAMRPELLASAGIDHQLNVVSDGFAGRSHQQFVELPVSPTEWPPAHFDGAEAARNDVLQRLAQWVRLVEED